MKYMGSKARIAKELLPIILRKRGVEKLFVHKSQVMELIFE